jgi:UDP-N-acetylmuramoylalanine-D-glutamate ligase
MQVALIESKAIAVSLAEIIAYLQRNQHLAALGTFQGLDERFKFLGNVLEAAARLPQK